MTEPTSDSRSDMVRSAARLIGAHGVSATSFSEVIEDSGAPRGSIYHHFPRGKEQLAEDAIAWTSEQILAHVAAAPGDDAVEVLDWFFGLWRRVARDSGGAAGCAVAGVSLDSDVDAAIQAVARVAFRAWTDALARRLRAAGVEGPDARRVAVAAVAAAEGGLILCRAEGGDGPMRDVARVAARLLGPDSGRRR